MQNDFSVSVVPPNLLCPCDNVSGVTHKSPSSPVLICSEMGMKLATPNPTDAPIIEAAIQMAMLLVLSLLDRLHPLEAEDIR